jgi:hypothetical protein
VLPRIGCIWITILLAAGACTSRAVAPSPGPWQFSGTLLALDGQVVGPGVAGAQMTLTAGDVVKANTTSDPSGHYVFSDVETGRFTLTISAPGFVTLTPAVNLDRNMAADFGLKRTPAGQN